MHSLLVEEILSLFIRRHLTLFPLAGSLSDDV